MTATRTVHLLALIVYLTQPRNSFAQFDRIDSCIASQMSNRHIPGLVLAVIQDGVPVKVKGYGIANIEHNIPVNPQTVFQSGSVGKQFTAMLVMLLVEQGKINLDKPISSYFANAPASWQTITVRHLLTHTSGIPNYTEGNQGINFRLDYTEDELLEKAMQLHPDFQPGEKWSYSNTGYVLLGILIHKVTGQFYGNLLKREIFQPLSMETARIINEAEIIPNRASGYQLENGEWKNQEWVSPTLNTTADGSLYFTILDLVKWEAALSSGKILSKAGFDQLWSPVQLTSNSLHPYGFGWYLSPFNGRRAVSHGGSWQGFNTFIARYIDDRLTVIVLVNLLPANAPKIARSVAALYVPELSENAPSSMPDKDPKFKETIEKLFGTPDTLDINYDVFTKDYRENVKPTLKRSLDFLHIFGPVRSIERAGHNHNQSADTLQYRIRYKVGSRFATIVRSASGQISSVSSIAE